MKVRLSQLQRISWEVMEVPFKDVLPAHWSGNGGLLGFDRVSSRNDDAFPVNLGFCQSDSCIQSLG